MMESPFEFTWALPEFDGICITRDEELSQFFKDSGSMNLKGVRIAVENFPCRMDRVCYDDDLGDIGNGTCLVDTTSDGEQLHLCTCNE